MADTQTHRESEAEVTLGSIQRTLVKLHGDLKADHARVEGKINGVDRSIDGMDKRIDGVDKSIDRNSRWTMWGSGIAITIALAAAAAVLQFIPS